MLLIQLGIKKHKTISNESVLLQIKMELKRASSYL